MFGFAAHLYRYCNRVFVALVGLYALATTLLFLTWQRLPDVIVDFGREVYVPWRLTVGDVLYVDVAYFNGPFSPYFNAACFSIFGTSITTLTVINFFLLLVLITLVFLLLNRICDLKTAVVCCVTFLVAFAYSHTLTNGNYNYICPYSHEMTHGITLIFAMLYLMHCGWRNRKITSLIVGVLWGLVFLGKAELFVAATSMLVGKFVLDRTASPETELPKSRTVWLLAGYFVAVASAFAGLWVLSSDPTVAIKGIAGTWFWMFGSDVTSEAFYQQCTGLDDPLRNLVRMAVATVSVLLTIISTIALAKSQSQNNPILRLVAVLLGAVAVALYGGVFLIFLNGRALPVVAILILALLIWRLVTTENPQAGQQIRIAIVWAILGGTLLLKMPLNATIMHYGFVLAMPMTILFVAICLQGVGTVLRDRQQARLAYRILCFLLAIDLIGVVSMSTINFYSKQVAVGQHGDRLNSSVRRGGNVISTALDSIEKMVAPDETVMVLPEGVMINYLSRRESATEYVNLCPPELTMYDESIICQKMAIQAADWIVLVNKDVREYGFQRFGEENYGREILDWIHENYSIVEVIGCDFADATRPGVTILKRCGETTDTNIASVAF